MDASKQKEAKNVNSKKQEKRAQRQEEMRKSAVRKVRKDKGVTIESDYVDGKRVRFKWTPGFTTSFLQAAQQHNKLRSLSVKQTSLDYDAVKAIVSLMTASGSSSSDTMQDMEKSLVGQKGTKSVGMGGNHMLTSLALCNTGVGPEGVEHLANALVVNTTLTKLDLSCNKFGPDGAERLANALVVNITLTELELRANQIGPEGAEHLANALVANTTLTWLGLQGNKIGDTGAVSFAHMLESNKTITDLNLRDNGITKEGALELADALMINGTLETLSLGDDGIDKTAARKLLNAVHHSGVKFGLRQTRKRMKQVEEEALRTKVGKFLAKHGFERLAVDFYEDNMRTLKQAAKVSGEQLKSYGEVTHSERKRLRQMLALAQTQHEKTPVGKMLVSRGYEKYVKKFYDEGVHQVEPLTHADLKEIGIINVEDEKALYALFNGGYVDLDREGSQEDDEKERVEEGQGQGPIVEVLPLSSEGYTEDEADKLFKWHKLYSTGAISRKEYDHAKAKVLKYL